jgi:hypothetical protein
MDDLEKKQEAILRFAAAVGTATLLAAGAAVYIVT